MIKTSVRETYLKDYGLTYDCMETDVREDDRKSFQRRPYPTVDVAQYLAKKFKIGVNADGKSDETFNTDILDT